MTVAAVIQARMGSTRLPGKVLMKIAAEPVLAHVVARSRAIDGVDEVIVATSDLPADDPIADLCRDRGWGCHRGSEADVLDRYLCAAAEWQVDQLIRVTADCPLLCTLEAGRVVARQLESSADCSHNLTAFGSGMPLGTGVEACTFAAIETSWLEGHAAADREHVLWYVHQHPERFRVELVICREAVRRPDYRLTVDTEEDLALVRAIYDNVTPTDGIVSLADVISFLDERPDLRELNQHVQQKSP